MNRMKTFFKYALWIVLFFIFSELIINAGLNASYKTMEATDSDVPGIEIEQAESTRINGRVKGKIKDTSELEGKYVKFDLYNDKDNLVGTKYVEVEPSSNTENSTDGSNSDGSNSGQDFSFFFQGEGIKYFKTSIVDKIQGSLGDSLKGFKILDHDLSKAEILTALIFTYGIFF